MIRTKGEAGTGNIVEAVRHVRAVMGGIRQLQSMDEDEIYVFAKEVRNCCIRSLFFRGTLRLCVYREWSM